MDQAESTLPPAADAPPAPAKPKHSRRVRKWQKADKGVSRAVSDLARAVSKGVDTWRRESEKSQDRRRNGAARDAMKNLGKAVSKFAKVASRVPEDLADAMDPLKTRWMKK